MRSLRGPGRVFAWIALLGILAIMGTLGIGSAGWFVFGNDIVEGSLKVFHLAKQECQSILELVPLGFLGRYGLEFNWQFEVGRLDKVLLEFG